MQRRIQKSKSKNLSLHLKPQHQKFSFTFPSINLYKLFFIKNPMSLDNLLNQGKFNEKEALERIVNFDKKTNREIPKIYSFEKYVILTKDKYEKAISYSEAVNLSKDNIKNNNPIEIIAVYKTSNNINPSKNKNFYAPVLYLSENCSYLNGKKVEEEQFSLKYKTGA